MKYVYMSLFVIAVFSLTFLLTLFLNKKTKYEVIDCNGRHYYTNKLLFDSEGCVKGWEDNKEFLVCGSYTVNSLK